MTVKVSSHSISSSSIWLEEFVVGVIVVFEVEKYWWW